MFYVYKIVNTVNNKLYIGKTSSPRKRWQKHLASTRTKHGKSLIHNAMKSHGVENFKMIVIDEFEIELDCLAREVELIAYYKTNIHKYGNDFGYNLTDGGDGMSGHRHTDDSKLKMSKLSKGKPKSQAHREALSKAHIGIPISEACKAAVSLRHKGKIVSKETRAKLAQTKLGTLNPASKLTLEEVIRIKTLFKDPLLTNADIYAKFKHVAPRTLRDIKNGLTWKNV